MYFRVYFIDCHADLSLISLLLLTIEVIFAYTMISIQLDSPTGVFFGGQTVTGQLVFSITTKTKYKMLESNQFFKCLEYLFPSVI